MSKKKNQTEKQQQQPTAKPVSSGRYLGHMEDACRLLGLNRRPSGRLAAWSAAQTLKSEWSNGHRNKLNAAINSSSDITNCFRNLRSSPVHTTAKELVNELGRNVPATVANHPEWPAFIAELQSAVS